MLCFNTPVVWFQLNNSYGEMCFLEENYKKMHKIQIYDKKIESAFCIKSLSMPLRSPYMLDNINLNLRTWQLKFIMCQFQKFIVVQQKKTKEGRNESLFQNNSPNICHFLKSDTCKLLYLKLSIDLLRIFHNAP